MSNFSRDLVRENCFEEHLAFPGSEIRVIICVCSAGGARNCLRVMHPDLNSANVCKLTALTSVHPPKYT
jgi:hypothetical protein